jgi:hypothetical protein
MEIRPDDLIKLKKDIERVRRHEEKRAREAAEQKSQPVKKEKAVRARPAPVPAGPGVPLLTYVRELLAAILEPSPSTESQEVLPDYLITVLQVIAEEPKFRAWLLRLQTLPTAHRRQQLTLMARAFRIEDGDSTIATTFDRLHDQTLFDAVCQFLREHSPGPAPATGEPPQASAA